MRFHSSRTNTVAPGDFLVRLTVRDSFEHITFATCEQRELGHARQAVRLDANGITQAGGHRRREERFAAVHRTHGIAQLVWRRVLAKIAVRACAYGLENV